MAAFLNGRTAEQIEADTEAFAVADPRTDVQKERDEQTSRLLRAEANDQDAARLLDLARRLHPSAWEDRQRFLELAAQERSGRRANEPAGRRLVATYERAAVSAIAHSIAQARLAADIVRSWSRP